MDFGLLVARLVFGITMSAHGAQKLFGWFGGYGVRGPVSSSSRSDSAQAASWRLPQGSASWRAAYSWPSVSSDLSVPR